MTYDVTLPKSMEALVSVLNVMISPRLSEREIQLLSAILVLNMEYRSLPVEKRMAFILSTSTKKELSKSLKMKIPQLSNYLKSLNTKKYFGEPIIQDSSLNKYLDIPQMPESIIFALDDRYPENNRESGQETRNTEEKGGGSVEAVRDVGGEPDAFLLDGDSFTLLGPDSGLPEEEVQNKD